MSSPIPMRWVLLTTAVCVLGGCMAPAFHYRNHRAPRISVLHEPLHPNPGELVTLTASAEGSGIERITIDYYDAEGGSRQRVCEGRGIVAGSCSLEVTATVEPGEFQGFGIYNASMRTAAGARRFTASSYVFQIGLEPMVVDPGRAIALRVPFDLYDTPTAARGFKILLVPDRDSFGAGSFRRFENSVLVHLNNHLLRDPAYRWRDNQLAFYAFTRSGVTADYDSGNESRCGQRPWPGPDRTSSFVARIAEFDVIGVLHTQTGFRRDCSGVGVIATGGAPKRHFSSFTGEPQTFQHELGHALFLLSDEYREDTATRQANHVATPPIGRCTCCAEIIGGTGFPECRGGFGVPCSVELLPPDCFPAETFCPPLASDCRSSNIFRSEAGCRAAAAAAIAHPGVEVPTDPGHCERLCSGDCPCAGAPPELWRLDRRHPAAPGGDADDVMGGIDAATPGEWNGAACELCMETTFCLAWERGRERTEVEALAHCVPAGAP